MGESLGKNEKVESKGNVRHMKDSKGEGERTKLDRNYMCITIFTPLPMGEGTWEVLALTLSYSKSPVTPSFTRLKKLVQLLLELFFEVVDCVVDLFC